MRWDCRTYASGLRLVDNHGNLNDGRVLPDAWQGVAYGGIFAVTGGLAILPTIIFYLLFNGKWDSVRPSPTALPDA